MPFPPPSELLAKFPWLVKGIKAGGDAAEDEPDDFVEPIAAARALETIAEGGSLSEGDALAVFKELEDKRAELAADGGLDIGKGAFAFNFVGGKWTAENKGLACNAVVTSAQGHHIEKWCKMYHLQVSASFEISVFTEKGAIFFAKTWKSWMEYLYGVWLTHADEKHIFTNEELEGWARPVERGGWFTPIKAVQQRRVSKLWGMMPRV